MAQLVSIASGKGGVGKSVVSSNLAMLLARAGRRVIIADVDIGGANLHLLFGIHNPPHTISDFMTHKVESLGDVAVDVEYCRGLSLLPGVGDTLANINPNYATKRRLMHHLRHLDADIVLLDVGAGMSYHPLDFFLLGDLQVIVAVPDPTSVLDAYKFLKLAAIRRVLSMFVTHSPVGEALNKQEFSSVDDVLAAVFNTDPESIPQEKRDEANTILRNFSPYLVLNRVDKSPRHGGRKTGGRLSLLQLRKVLKQYVGSTLHVLGEIPDDIDVARSVRNYLPVVESAPSSAGAKALRVTADILLSELDKLKKVKAV